jgi:hypothetical protein
MRQSDFIFCESGAADLHADDKLRMLGRRDKLRRFGDGLWIGLVRSMRFKPGFSTALTDVIDRAE